MRIFLLSTVAFVGLGLSMPSVHADLYPIFSKRQKEEKEDSKDVKKEDKAAEGESKDSKASGESEKKEDSKKEVVDAPKHAPGSPEAVVVAKVNGKEITLGQVKDKMSSLPPQIQGAPFDKVFGPLVDHVINSELLTKAAKDQGLDKDPKVKQKQAECENMMLQQAYLEGAVEKLATDSVLKEHFAKLIKSIPKGEKEFRLRHILVSAESEAKDLIKELKTNSDFSELAKKKSKDRSKEKGGDLGYLRKGEMPKGFSTEVSKAAAGAVLPKPVKTEAGWHVIKVEDKRDIELPKFEQVRGELKNMVAPHLALDVIKGLRKDVKIERFDRDGKPVLESKAGEKAESGEKELKKEEASADKLKTPSSKVAAPAG